MDTDGFNQSFPSNLTSISTHKFIPSRDSHRSDAASERSFKSDGRRNDLGTDSGSSRVGRSSSRRQQQQRNMSPASEKSDRQATQPTRNSRSKYMTQIESRRLADRKSLLDRFVAQAEERDMKAKMEQEAMASLTNKSRIRSTSLTRPSSSTYSANSNGINSSRVKRSNSTSTRTKPVFVTGIRRSRSSVDINEIINNAEQRDQRAKVEQATLKGLPPSNRNLERKNSITLKSRNSASDLIQHYQNKEETDGIILTGRARTYGLDHHLSCSGNVDNSDKNKQLLKTSMSQKPARTHRKFSSFLANSRVGRPGGISRSGRYSSDSSSNDTDSYKNALYQAHNARTAMWNDNSEQQYSDCPPLSTDVEIVDATSHKPDYIANRVESASLDLPNLLSDGYNKEDKRPNKADVSFQMTFPSNEITSTITQEREFVSKSPRLHPRDESQLYQSPSVRNEFQSPPTTPGSTTQEAYNSRNPTHQSSYRSFPTPPFERLEPEESSKRHFRPIKPEMLTIPDTLCVSANSPVLHNENIPSMEYEMPSNVWDKAINSAKKSQAVERPKSGKVDATEPNILPKDDVRAHVLSSSSITRNKSPSAWEKEERGKEDKSRNVKQKLLQGKKINNRSAKTDLTPSEKDRLKRLVLDHDSHPYDQEDGMHSERNATREGDKVGLMLDGPSHQIFKRTDITKNEADDADIQQGVNTKDDENQTRWEEEQRRKKVEADIRAKQAAERREERRRERERVERERKEEKRKYEEERARLQEEREKDVSRIKSVRDLIRKEEEQLRRLEEIRRMREEEERQLHELQEKRQAEELLLRSVNVQKHEQEMLLKQRKAEDREDAEREFLEEKLSVGKPSSFTGSFRNYVIHSPRSSVASSPVPGGLHGKRNAFKTSYSTTPSLDIHPAEYDSRSTTQEHRSTFPRPALSDRYALGKSASWSDEEDISSYASTPNSSMCGGWQPVNYVVTTDTPKVIGAQEVYNDPIRRREATMKQEESHRRDRPDPSRLNVLDRQRLFRGGSDSPGSRPRSSRKFM